MDTLEWKEKDFDLNAALSRRRGPLVEVGGPTEVGYKMVPQEIIEKSGKQLFTSNLHVGRQITETVTGKKVEYVVPADFAADARKMPHADGSIGALFVSALNIAAISGAIQEASRILEKDGLLIWQGPRLEGIMLAEKLGLHLKAYEWKLQKGVLSHVPKNLDMSNIVSAHKTVAGIMSEKLGFTLRDDYNGIALSDGSNEMGSAQDIESIVPYYCIFQKN